MTDHLPLIRETLAHEAREQMRDYPQYQLPEAWRDLIVATIVRHIRTKLGEAFSVGDLTVVRRQSFPQIGKSFPVAWSFRNRCWTAVGRADYEQGLVSDVTIFRKSVVAAVFRDAPIPRPVVVGLLRGRRNALILELVALPEDEKSSGMLASIRCPLCAWAGASAEERRSANRATRIMHAVGCLDHAIVRSGGEV